MKILLGILALYFTLVLLVFIYQKNLLFFPDRTPLKACPSITTLGGNVHSLDGGQTRFYLIKGQIPKPKGWVLHFHGNGGRACDRLSSAKNFLKLGYHLVLAEYPGYAEEAPLPSQTSILAAAEGSMKYILEENQQELPIVLFGESLGTGPATYLASKNYKNVTNLILQTPYPGLEAVGQKHYPYLPVQLILTERFPAKEWAPLVNVPVFIFHGNKDEVIPFELGLEQSQNFKSELVNFWEVDGAHHNDLVLVAGEKLWEKLTIFLR